jgi:putative addiction module component (TIGR02574 family)
VEGPARTRYHGGWRTISPSYVGKEALSMTTDSQAIFDAALALPEPERAMLVERLLESLSPEPDELTDDDFFAELERRRAEVEQGLVKPIPWREVRLEE